MRGAVSIALAFKQVLALYTFIQSLQLCFYIRLVMFSL